MSARLQPDLERELRLTAVAAKVTMPGSYVGEALAEIDALRVTLARVEAWAAGVGLRSSPDTRADIDALLAILRGDAP